MKTNIRQLLLLTSVTLLTGYATIAQKATTNDNNKNTKKEMKTYVIEREIPDAGKLTPQQLKEISQKSCGVLKEMGSQIEWVQSYVAENKIYCIYRAENKELVKEHAKKGGFPANSISEVSAGISPATAGQ